MSASRHLISLGAPYFQLAQQDMAGMDADGLWGSGLCDLSAIVKVNALPPALASPTEMHPFLSFQYKSGPLAWTALLEVGVTPNGAVRATSSTGADISSGDGALTAGSGWHSVRAFYDYVPGDLLLVIDGSQFFTDTDAGGSPITSPAGETMRIVMFNGASLISRTNIAMRSALAYANDISQDGGQHPSVWGFKDGYGINVTAQNYPEDFPGIDFTLTAEIGQPSSPLYGASSGTIGDAMRWELETEWTQRYRPTTSWTKAGVV